MYEYWMFIWLREWLDLFVGTVVNPPVTHFCYLLTFLTVSINAPECTEPLAQHDIVIWY